MAPCSTSLCARYLPRLKFLDLSFNKLQILPELLGLPLLQHLDASDNLIGRHAGRHPPWRGLVTSPAPPLAAR